MSLFSVFPAIRAAAAAFDAPMALRGLRPTRAGPSSSAIGRPSFKAVFAYVQPVSSSRSVSMPLLPSVEPLVAYWAINGNIAANGHGHRQC